MLVRSDFCPSRTPKAAAVVGVMAGAGMELVFLLLLSGVMAWSMILRPNQSLFRSVGLAFIPLAIMLLAMAWDNSWIEGPVGLAFREAWTQSVETMPVPEGLNVQETRAAWNEWGSMLLRILPGITGLMWLTTLSVTAVLIRKVLVRRQKVKAAPLLINWRSPDWIVWLFLAPALVMLAVANGWLADTDKKWMSVGGNVLLVTSAVYCFQGLQVMRWRMAKAQRRWIVWTALVVAFLLLGGAALVSLVTTLAMVGIFDYWFDFRRLETPEKKEEP